MFYLSRTDGTWRVFDIDFEDPPAAKRKVDAFEKKYPAAEKVIKGLGGSDPA